MDALFRTFSNLDATVPTQQAVSLCAVWRLLVQHGDNTPLHRFAHELIEALPRRVSVHFIRDVHRHPQRHHTAGIVEEVRLWKEKNRAFKVRLIRDQDDSGSEGMPELVVGAKEPQYGRNGQYRPVISTAAPFDLRSLLLALDKYENASEIAEQCVATQLKAGVKTLEQTRAADITLRKPLGIPLDRLDGVAVLGTSPESDVIAIAKAAAANDIQDTKSLWTWEKLPYVVRCAGLASEPSDASRPKKKTRVDDEDKFVADLDEWILRNETYLRLLSRAAKLKPDSKPWRFGLLRLEDVPTVIPVAASVIAEGGGSPIAVKIARGALASVPGFSVLDARRADAVYIQPSAEAFRAQWNAMTGNLLQGLDWSNVCVAGGLVLGTLLTPEFPAEHADAKAANRPEEWKSSDIDLYIYGLDVDAANKKVKHIANTYEQNLPSGAPLLCVRNSQTITLYSQYPLRRVQIVLKLVSSPREVLLNFDLDVVAAAFDGEQVWMLPRFVRALETGTNVFTMDLISGHYLGDRKATRDKRVFKYANKGYGMRILPSYIASLSTYNTRKSLPCNCALWKLMHLKHRAESARQWTAEVIEEYLQVGHKDSPFHRPKPHPPIASSKPVFSHAMLESYAQVTSEPLGRSCLTSFTLFMRHVALWEEEVAGRITIFEDLWATDTYGESSLQEVSYDDSPPYTWDEQFSVAEFMRAIDSFNKKELTAAYDRLDDVRGGKLPTISAARITYAKSIDELMSSESDLRIPLILPQRFRDFANKLTLQGLRQSHPPSKDRAEGPLSIIGHVEEHWPDAPVLWCLDNILNWQMLDRSIDEVREALWAFHRANERTNVDPEHSVNVLKTNLSRRAIRTSVEDEMEAFVRWVGRKPYHDETKLNAVFMMEEGGSGHRSGGW